MDKEIWRERFKLPFTEKENQIFSSNGDLVFEISLQNPEIVEDIVRRVNDLPPKLLLTVSGEFTIRESSIFFLDHPIIVLKDIGSKELLKSMAKYICDKLNKPIEIYTSYFANIRRLPDNFCPISIARSPIKGWNGVSYLNVAPLLTTISKHKSGLSTEEEYTEEYTETILSQTTPVKVVDELLRLADGKIPCLICYEALGKFCHRHILADWLRGDKVNVQEYKP